MAGFPDLKLIGLVYYAQHPVYLVRYGKWRSAARNLWNPIVMVTIRLSRGGAKKQPFYHIVATDSRARRDGRYIERLGFYNPVARSNAEPVRLDLERLDHWIGHGAQMSPRVKKIVKGCRKAATESAGAAA